MELRLALPFDAGQMYGLTFSAPRHRPAWQIVRRLDFLRTAEQVERDDVILRLMLVPDSPGTTDLPKGLTRLQQIASPFSATGAGIDAATFKTLDVAAQMAFLNIDAKLRETVIDGTPLMSFVRGVRHVAVDRVFLLFDAGLKPRMTRAMDFAGAPGHGAPEGLPRSARASRQLEAHAICRRQRPALVLQGRRSAARRRRRGAARALGRRGHRSRPRPGPRARVAREQRLPTRPQDESGIDLRAALRAGHPAAVHARPG